MRACQRAARLSCLPRTCLDCCAEIELGERARRVMRLRQVGSELVMPRRDDLIEAPAVVGEPRPPSRHAWGRRPRRHRQRGLLHVLLANEGPSEQARTQWQVQRPSPADAVCERVHQPLERNEMTIGGVVSLARVFHSGSRKRRGRTTHAGSGPAKTSASHLRMASTQDCNGSPSDAPRSTAPTKAKLACTNMPALAAPAAQSERRVALNILRGKSLHAGPSCSNVLACCPDRLI